MVLARETVPHLDARIFAEPVAPTLLLASDRVDEAVLTTMPEHVFVERWSAAEGVAGALRALAARGIGELLVEPGPRLLSALWDAGLVDRLVTVSAGGMAGEDAPVLYRGLGDWQGDSLLRRMSPFEAGIVGDVSVTVWRPSDAAAE